jgi:hypothetical protein
MGHREREVAAQREMLKRERWRRNKRGDGTTREALARRER